MHKMVDPSKLEQLRARRSNIRMRSARSLTGLDKDDLTESLTDNSSSTLSSSPINAKWPQQDYNVLLEENQRLKQQLVAMSEKEQQARTQYEQQTEALQKLKQEFQGELESKVSDMEKKLKESEMALFDEQFSSEEKTIQVEELETEVKRLTSSVQSKMETIDSLKESNEELEKEKEEAEEKLELVDELEEDKIRLTKALEEAQLLAEQFQAEIKMLTQQAANEIKLGKGNNLKEFEQVKKQLAMTTVSLAQAKEEADHKCKALEEAVKMLAEEQHKRQKESEQEIERLKEEIVALQEDKARLEEASKIDNEQIEELLEELQSSRPEPSQGEARNEEMELLKEEIAALQQDKARLEEASRVDNEQIEALLEEMQSSRPVQGEARDEEMELLRAEIAALQEAKTQLQEASKVDNEHIEELLETLEALHQNPEGEHAELLQQKDQEIVLLKQQIAALQEDKARLEEATEVDDQHVEVLMEELVTLHQKVEGSKHDGDLLQARDEEIALLRAENAGLQEEKARLIEESKVDNAHVEELLEALEALNQKVDELENQSGNDQDTELLQEISSNLACNKFALAAIEQSNRATELLVSKLQKAKEEINKLKEEKARYQASCEPATEEQQLVPEDSQTDQIVELAQHHPTAKADEQETAQISDSQSHGEVEQAVDSKLDTEMESSESSSPGSRSGQLREQKAMNESKLQARFKQFSMRSFLINPAEEVQRTKLLDVLSS